MVARKRSAFPKKIQRRLWILLILAVFLLLLFLARGRAVVSFSDPVLEQLVRQAILNPTGPILASDLRNITTIEARNMGVSDLEGIQYLVNLKQLDLRYNELVNIELLSHCKRLEALDLRETGLTDIAFLSSLTRLVELNLRGNAIVDISPLTGLTSLRALNLRENTIYDIAPLATMVNLADLNLRHNQISDITPLANLPQLHLRLYLDGNPINDYSPVADYFDAIDDKDFELLYKAPQSSLPGGFYAMEEVLLEFTVEVPDAVIYYTLDVSLPDNNALRYESPLRLTPHSEPYILAAIPTNKVDWKQPDDVFKGTVVRVVAYLGDWPISMVGTQTYLLAPNIKERYGNLAVISLVTEARHLFSPDIGIYVPGDLFEEQGAFWRNPANYNQRGSDWERPVHVTFFEPDGSLGWSMDMGLRIHGRATRTWPQKSLRLYARAEYGSTAIHYPLFGEGSLSQYRRFILRNSGNDWYSTLFRDGLIQGLLAGDTLSTQNYRPTVVFLNGEFWGIHNLRERYDKYYLEEHFGVDPEAVDILEHDLEIVVKEGNRHHYDSMITYMQEHDLRQNHHYQKVSTMMDIDSFIDHHLTHIFSGNSDAFIINEYLWRPQTPEGTWRWLLVDTDFGFGLETPVTHNTLWLATHPHYYDMAWATFILRSLLENETFRNKFINRYADLLNTTWRPDFVETRIDALQAELSLVIQEHIARWGYPQSVEQWLEEISHMRQWVQARPDHARQHVVDKFGLDGLANLQVEIIGQGKVEVNSLTVDTTSWRGTYFIGIPVNLHAQAEEGWQFVGWENAITGKTPTQSLNVLNDTTVRAVFKRK